MEENRKKKHDRQSHPQGETIGEEMIENATEAGAAEKDEIEGLRKKLEEKEKEAKEAQDRLLRIAADFENYKKRAAREKEEWLKYASEDLLKAILPFIDNLERAVNHSEKLKDAESLIAGVKLTIQQLLQALNKFGLSTFESRGKPFDPAIHEAVLVVQSDKEKPDHVMEEFQRGYMLNGRLLRPATVSVAKPPERESRKTQ